MVWLGTVSFTSYEAGHTGPIGSFLTSCPDTFFVFFLCSVSYRVCKPKHFYLYIYSFTSVVLLVKVASLCAQAVEWKAATVLPALPINGCKSFCDVLLLNMQCSTYLCICNKIITRPVHHEHSFRAVMGRGKFHPIGPVWGSFA